ncbi:hypothetical protein COOONC_25313 [Cooperia oncophora]
MLGNVLARKRGRRKKRNSLTPQIEHYASPCKQEAHPSDDVKPCQNVQNRRNNSRRAVQDVSNHKITEFFPVRRSSRKTGKQLEVGTCFEMSI